MISHRRRLALVAVAVLIAACGDDKPRQPPLELSAPPASTAPEIATPTKPAATAPYRVVPVERGGTIAGVCRLDGTATPAKLRAKPAMGIEEGQDDGSVVEGERHALGGCVVSLAAVESGKDWSEAMRTDDRSAMIRVQRGRYEPRVLLVREQTQLVFQGAPDTPDMNVHGYFGPGRSDTKFNFGISAGLRVATEQTFLKRPGVYQVTEDSGSGYLCWVVVMASPYAELTSAEPRQGRPAGEYRLEDVPAGDYDLVCWHEPMDRSQRVDGARTFYVLGPPIEIRRRVHVAAGKTTTEDFDVPATAAGAK